jgi:choline dehydrogenase
MRRNNLTVVMRALTSSVIIENGRATGVKYLRNGQAMTAQANREVILCGGSYNSPQLLMLSGIGPADHLREHGIAPKVDLPGVGENLAEHPLVPLVMETLDTVSMLRYLRMDRAALWGARWFLTGTGAFATTGNSAGLFTRTRPDLERPDVQLLYGAVGRDARLWWPGQSGRQKFTLQCSISLQHPEALGNVKLRSANPADRPRIFLNLFGAQADIDTAIRGMRLAREIYEHEPIARLIRGELVPGRHATSDAALTEYIRAVASTTFHPAGTCKMGHDPMAVVDDKLRVRGVDGLRVADASIMPTIPGGHINAPTIMIGERAADFVLGKAPLPPAPV